MGRRLQFLLAFALLAGAILSYSLDLQCYTADVGCCQEHVASDNCGLQGALAGAEAAAAPPPASAVLAVSFVPPPPIPSVRPAPRPDRPPPGPPPDTASSVGLRAPPR